MEFIAIKKWADDYNGAGIYSLTDENGKKYIGQSKHIQDRLHTHRQNLNRAAKNIEVHAIENEGLIEYAKNGGVLTAEILLKLPWNMATKNNLRHFEGVFCRKYGYKNIYNSIEAYPPHWDFEPDNEIEVQIICDKTTDADIMEKLATVGNMQGYIKELIRADMKKN
jgi:predicted GIY-YIG superfamily endonuclease